MPKVDVCEVWINKEEKIKIDLVAQFPILFSNLKGQLRESYSLNFGEVAR